ncbi:hypothetical protein SUGI_0776630 [Cryptomeria japonica]|nr:hypothetical protein SUGI_0776630 [Cryptomeria japonica]
MRQLAGPHGARVTGRSQLVAGYHNSAHDQLSGLQLCPPHILHSHGHGEELHRGHGWPDFCTAKSDRSHLGNRAQQSGIPPIGPRGRIRSHRGALAEAGVMVILDNHRYVNDDDNRYLNCILAFLAEEDVDWALWTMGEAIIKTLRRPTAFSIVSIRNPDFISRLREIQQPIQDPYLSPGPYYQIIYHPASGLC